MKIIGKCNECGNEVKLVCHSLITREFQIVTKDSSKIKHVKKRPISNYVRKEMGEKLINQKALKVRRSISKQKIQYGSV